MHLISTKGPIVKKPEKAVLLVLTSRNNKLQLIVYHSPTFDDLIIVQSPPIICQWRDVLPIAYTRKRLHLQPYKGACGGPDSSSRTSQPFFSGYAPPSVKGIGEHKYGP